MKKLFNKIVLIIFIFNNILLTFFYIKYYILFPININNHFHEIILNKIAMLEKHRMYLHTFNDDLNEMENNMPNEYVAEFKNNFFYVIDNDSTKIKKLYIKNIRNYNSCFLFKSIYEYYSFNFDKHCKEYEEKNSYLDSYKEYSNYFKYNFKNIFGFILFIINIFLIKNIKEIINIKILRYIIIYLIIINLLYIIILIIFNLEQFNYLFSFHKMKYEIEKNDMIEKIELLKELNYNDKIFHEKTNLELKTTLTNSNYHLIYDSSFKLKKIINPDAYYYWHNPFKRTRYRALYYDIEKEQIFFEVEKINPKTWPNNKYIIQLNEFMKLLEYLIISIVLEILIIYKYRKISLKDYTL